MTELLQNGRDLPRIILDDDNHEPRPIEDDSMIDPEDLKPISFEFVEREDLPVVSYYPASLVMDVPGAEAESGLEDEAVHRATPYEELGGIAVKECEQVVRPLDRVTTDSEPWQTEIYDAVERFGMNELSLEDFKKMENTPQGRDFIIFFSRYFRAVTSRQKKIDLKDRGPGYTDELTNLYARDPDSTEVREYAKRLRALIEAMNSTGIPAAVTENLDRHPRRLAESKRDTVYTDYQFTPRKAKAHSS